MCSLTCGHLSDLIQEMRFGRLNETTFQCGENSVCFADIAEEAQEHEFSFCRLIVLTKADGPDAAADRGALR